MQNWTEKQWDLWVLSTINNACENKCQSFEAKDLFEGLLDISNQERNKGFVVLLPPAYVVRREGNSFTLFVSPNLGEGYPYPIMLCNISHNAMGQPPGRGVPCQVQPVGGSTLVGGTLVGGTLPGGYPGQVPPPGQVRTGGVPS